MTTGFFRSGSQQNRLSALGLVIAGLSAFTVKGTEPPTPEKIEQYRKDGTLKQRIQAIKELGNHKMDSDLVEQANDRIRRMAISRFGTPEQRAQLTRTPPPYRRGMPTKGDVNVVVLCIDFNDFPHSEEKNSIEKLQSRIFGDGDGAAAFPYESLRNFYRRSSFNQLEIKGNVLGWYRPEYPRTSVVKNPLGRQNLIKEALEYYENQGHDFSQYDNNGDGKIDYIAVVWSGPLEDWGEFWWAYQTSWGGSLTPLNLDGKTIGKYSWQYESGYRPKSDGTLPAIGSFVPLTLIHETGHALGLPDYYDYDGDKGPDGGVGGWDMMASNAGDHNCFSKFLLDWITPEVVTSAQAGVQLRSAAETGDAVIVMPDADVDNAFGEYFMVQNRQKTGNDKKHPGSGLMIWHVDARLNKSGKDFEFDNSYSNHKLLRLMEADGLEEIENGIKIKQGDKVYLYPGEVNASDYFVAGKSFGPNTKPSSIKYDGSYSWLGIENVSPSASTMTFDVVDARMDVTAPQGVPGTPTDEGDVARKPDLKFDWTQGNAKDLESGIASYELQVGTTPGGKDVFEGVVGLVQTKTVLELGKDGEKHYARVRAINGAGLCSEWSPASNGIRVELPVLGGNALDGTAQVFKLSREKAWIEDANESMVGGSSVVAGPLQDNQSRYLQTKVIGPGTLSFYWKVSSEPNGDVLSFQMDGAPAIDKISGEQDWTRKTLEIPAGEHLLRWTYLKDAMGSKGQDKAWVDGVTFVAEGQTLPVVSSIDPASGPVGTSVILTGAHFSQIRAVTFNDRASTFSVLNDTQIKAVVPKSATSGPIAVITLDGKANGPRFTVTAPVEIAPFVIELQPVAQSVQTDAAVSFSVKVSGGTAPYTYQWFKNGNVIPGATAAHYSLVAQKADDQGKFHVVVKDQAGQIITSKYATLVIQGQVEAQTQPQVENLIQNGHFEQGRLAWKGSMGTIHSWKEQPAFEGVRMSWLGGNGKAATEAIYQDVQIPAVMNAATLSFQLHINTDEPTPFRAYDVMTVSVKNSAGKTLKVLETFSNLNAASGYKKFSYDLREFKGQSVQIHFGMKEDAMRQTSFVLDQVSLISE